MLKPAGSGLGEDPGMAGAFSEPGVMEVMWIYLFQSPWYIFSYSVLHLGAVIYHLESLVLVKKFDVQTAQIDLAREGQNSYASILLSSLSNFLCLLYTNLKNYYERF